MKRTILLAAILLLPLLASGCNTVAGAGEDIEASGKALSNSADKNKDY